MKYDHDSGPENHGDLKNAIRREGLHDYVCAGDVLGHTWAALVEKFLIGQGQGQGQYEQMSDAGKRLGRHFLCTKQRCRRRWMEM